jgi:hypothetical protein
MKAKAISLVALTIVLLFAVLWVKLALLRTAIIYGGGMFMVALVAVIAIAAILMLALRGRLAHF